RAECALHTRELVPSDRRLLMRVQFGVLSICCAAALLYSRVHDQRSPTNQIIENGMDSILFWYSLLMLTIALCSGRVFLWFLLMFVDMAFDALWAFELLPSSIL